LKWLSFFLLPAVFLWGEAVALLLAPLTAVAVEKCIDAKGKISYLDICPPDSTRAPAKTDDQFIQKPGAGTTVIKPEIKPTPEPASGPVKIEPIPPPPPPPPPPAASAAEVLAPVLPEVPADVRLSYYEVQGADQASLLAALNASGAKHGQASWKLTYEYVPKRGMRECAVGSVSTKLELGMTLPRWTPPGGTPQELIARWERFLKALVAHQNARLDPARELERSLGTTLTSLEPARDCAALDSAVKERYATLEEQAKAKSQSGIEEIIFE
jgi:predicted secreted Zn-dependent protease